MKKIILLIIIIIAAENGVYAMKPYHGSVINQWNKQFEISNGINHYANLGKEKPMAIELSRLPKPVQTYRPANRNEETALKEAPRSEQDTTLKTVTSERGISQIPQKLVETEEPAALAEFLYLSDLAGNFMDIPREEYLFRYSDVWKSMGSTPGPCDC